MAYCHGYGFIKERKRSLDFARFSSVNRERCRAWMAEKDSLLHHAVGLAGEVGELCNIIKKIDRRGKPGSLPPANAKSKAADELADIVIYADLVAKHLRINLGAAIVRKFNRTSKKHGFKHRL